MDSCDASVPCTTHLFLISIMKISKTQILNTVVTCYQVVVVVIDQVIT